MLSSRKVTGKTIIPLRRIKGMQENLVLWAVGIALAALVLYPVLSMLIASFRTGFPGETGPLSLRNYVRAFGDPVIVELSLNTAVFAIGQTLVALIFGTGLAWVVTRTNVPFKNSIEFLTVSLFFMPLVLVGVAWSILFSPRGGIGNELIMSLFSLQEPPIDIYTMGGMIWVQSIYLVPLVFLIMVAAFRAINPELETAANVFGASKLKTAIKITLGLTRPSLISTALLLMIIGIESIEIPLIFGMPGGVYVYTADIYSFLKIRYPPEFGTATALSTALLCVSIIGVLLYQRATQHAGRYATISGKGFPRTIVDLGRWKTLVTLLVGFFFLMSVVLPLGVVFLGSLLPYFDLTQEGLMGNMSTENYAKLVEYPVLRRAIWNTGLLSMVSSSVVLGMVLLIAYFTIRRRGIVVRGLEVISTLPMTLPRLVLGVALLWTYITLPIPIYGTLVILGIAYVTQFIPIGVRQLSGSVIQVHRELEEAARVFGASWLQSFWRIIVPILKPALGATWLLAFITFVREFAASSILYSYGTEVISVVMYDLFTNGDLGAVSALGTVVSLAIIGVTILLKRVFRVWISF